MAGFAAGGVGTFAVQIARWRGAYVIGSASRCDAEFLATLGCNEVIDYKAARFEEVAHEIDLVLDTVGGDTTDRSWRILRPGGVLVTTVPPPSALWATGQQARGIFFVVEPDRGQLIEIARLIDDGEMKPIVEAIFPLARAREAYERGLHEHPRGKLVLRVAEEN
jgi:NADPH:quinone reductase-like Zn-dependent oxidoreductase